MPKDSLPLDPIVTRLQLLVTSLKIKIQKLSYELEDMNNEATNPIQRALVAKQDVLKVSHKIKADIGPITTNKTALVHIGNYSDDLSGIKINQFGPNRPPVDLRNMYILTLIYKTGVRNHYFIKNDLELINTINTIRKLSSLMNITEYSLTKGMIKACDSSARSLSFWDTTPWEDERTHGLYYDKVNDPIVLEQFINRVLPLTKDFIVEKPIIVIDMGGGKGRLADKLIAAAVDRSIPIHYILVEPSRTQSEIALKQLSKYKANKMCHIEVVQSSIEHFNPTVRAHCVISSGAVINMNVVTRTQAIQNTHKLASLLSGNGFLIATGQTAITIKSKHFLAAGMRVLSYAMPCPTPPGYERDPFLEDAKVRGGFFGHYQRYLCQKIALFPSSSEPPTPLTDSGTKTHSGTLRLWDLIDPVEKSLDDEVSANCVPR